MILGFFGMIISVWILLGCMIGLDFGVNVLIIGLVYPLIVCLFRESYSIFCNVSTDLYLILPPEKQPFFGVKKHVVFFGLFHFTASIASFF
ncbi:unnamed protein product [Caenorhabditis nigoni]